MKKINFDKIRDNKKNKLKIKFRKNRNQEVITKPKVEKAKKKSKKLRFGYYLLVLITFLAICAFVGCIGFCYYIYKSAPEFDPKQLYEKEATLIYDSNENLIATLGTEKREKITYDELPEVLIDAIIATEDSRFFQHNGFDFPRFAKATLGQLIGKSGAGGASTLTMQVSKNSFTSTESSGVAGIIRKFTDIYMSVFKIEKNYTKEEILELYVNSPYLGGGAYGVEQASRAHFGKSVKDLSLAEASLIAGLFQAPGAYDPYLNPTDAEARRNQVLNLMVRHGYIDKELADATKKISVKSLLVSENNNSDKNKYQGFIDTVVQEVLDNTGSNPYDVPMIIYSTMVSSKQDAINSFYSKYKFPNDKAQLGIAVINNNTGAILAVGTGRSTTDKMTWNAATQSKAHPGSTAKPLFEYGPGIEYLKWSTYTPFFDEKGQIKYSSGKAISNYNNDYDGLLTLKTCLVESKNTCALQAFQKLDNKLIYNFVTSVGITPETTNEYVGESHSVGGFTGASPVQMASAYQIFANGGYYNKSYSYTKIIFRESEEVIETNVTKTKIISPQTAYLITNILLGVTPSSSKISNTDIATKTGTSTYDEDFLKKYKLQNANIIRDSWVVSYTTDYTLAFWYGYKSLDEEHRACKCYNTFSAASRQRKEIGAALSKSIFDKNAKFKKPTGISSVEVELETIPAQKASEYTPSSLKQTHLFVTGSEPTETSSRFSKLAAPSNLTVNEVGSTVNLSWVSPGIPTAVDSTYLGNYFNSGYGNFAEKYLNKRLAYNQSYIGSFGFDIYLIKGSTSKYIGWTSDTNYTINLLEHTGTWDAVVVKSAYSKFKTNNSDGIKKYLSTYQEPISINITMKSLSMKKNTSWGGSNSSDITSIKINNESIDNYQATLQISSIKNSSGEIAIGNMLSTPDTYTVSYLVTFSYNDASGVNKRYTEKTTQSVAITEN